jgi:hypothetical protein
MSMRTRFGVGLLVISAGCGPASRNEEANRQMEQGAQQIQRGAETMAAGAKRGASEMASGVQEMARGLRQMAQGSATPVPYESLVAFVPEIPGWTRSEPRGENLSRPIAYARAEARYTQGTSRVRLEIIDTALSQILIAPVSMFLAAGYAERSTDGFKRAATIGGHPGAEDWNTRSRRGEVMVLVANRFLVKARGDDVTGVEVVRQAVEAVDLGKLAALK